MSVALRWPTPDRQPFGSEFETLSAREFATSRLRLTIPAVPFVVRTPDEEGLPPELLLEISLPAGSTSITIDYELLD